LVTSVATGKHIKMSMYWESLLTSMGMFGDRRETLVTCIQVNFCEAFNGHFGNKQTHRKLYWGTHW